MLEESKKKFILNRMNEMFDELNDITAQIIKEDNVKKASEHFNNSLVMAYLSGFTAINYLLDKEVILPSDFVNKTLNKEYDGESINGKFGRYYKEKDWNKIKTLLDSEVHRVYENGKQDCGEKSGIKLNKIWRTQLDNKVRDTHYYLEGVRAPLDGYFVTFDGDKAKFPCGFSMAQNNVNCRCYIDYKIADNE